MFKAWADDKVHFQAVDRLGDTVATYLEREATHRNTVVSTVCTNGDGMQYACLRNGEKLCWINGVWIVR